MANSYLTRTNSSTGSTTVATVSMWVKLSSISTDQALWEMYADNSNYFRLRYRSDSSLSLQADISNSTILNKITNRKFRDTSGWYHIVIQINLADSTAEDKIKLYINGERETSFSTNTNTSVTSGNWVGGGNSFNVTIGRHPSDAAYLQGYLSHYCFVDGTVVAPTSFGQTDSTSGIWKFKSPTGLTFGTNGFHLKFENSGALGTDSSGNSNTFTVNGNLKQGLDTPSNVYATINPLFVNDDGATNALTDGGNTYTSTTRGEWNNMTSTLGATTGKWYWEVKFTQLINASTIYMNSEGVASTDLAPANLNLGEGTRSGYGYGWLCGNRNTTSNTRYLKTVNGTATLTTDSNNTPVVAGDIVGVAWDATNGKLWFHKNGTYIDDLSGNVGNPSTGVYPYHTGMQTGILYTVWADNWQNASGTSLIKSYNFGNGFFGTTAITSAGSNGNGSLFEYDVPSGFYALNTKNINTYG